MAWAPEWALVREWEEWPWCDFLPLAALCLGGSPTSAGILTPPVSTGFALRADARRTTTRAYGSDGNLLPQASGTRGRTAPSEK
ncbi:hypothetical protein BQ8482_170006 [Mesorhizobium delmotii]|uniref:Uncharacterized protein n=1 Tax=Mesorhizobium delmotii TaxID=1631247 RepID=A0A2P9AHQ8_9HYPH|nr:hypothetical protein BQ8482_170006 [Mesorhizobium delmotii]